MENESRRVGIYFYDFFFFMVPPINFNGSYVQVNWGRKSEGHSAESFV